MEKICIVKRRREYTQPEVKITVIQPEANDTVAPEIIISSVSLDGSAEFPDQKLPEVKFEVSSPKISETIAPETIVNRAPAENYPEFPDEKKIEEFVDYSDSVISIVMTKEQSDLLMQSEYINELLNGTKSDPALDINLTPDGRLSLNYRFNDSLQVRMLASKQVCQMLQVSRSFLQKLIHEKKIKSYKLGRIRRFLLEDVLEYLSNDAEFSPLNNEQ